MSQRPNILLIITDQHRADWLGCTGHPVLTTPNIDRIAAMGVTFDRCYVASPVCMPNRASLMTGRMPMVHGVRCNGIPLPWDTVTFAELLRRSGYRTALIGKSHLQSFTGNPPIEAIPDAARDPILQQESPQTWSVPGADLQRPYYGFDDVALVTGHGDSVGGHYRRWLAARTADPEALIGSANALAHDYTCPQALRTRVPAELYSTAYIADEAVAYLQAHTVDAGPFLLIVSFPDPHHPFNPPGRYWDLYRPEQFAVPQAYTRNDWVPPPHVAAVHAMRDTGQANIQGMASIGVSAREAQEAQALTAGMITCIDDAVGRILDALDASRATSSTIRIFTSDHGDHLGDHRLLFKGSEQYQSIIRVPLLWSEPGHSTPQRTASLVSTIDISASILDAAGVAAVHGQQGRSFRPMHRDAGIATRDAVLVQYEHQRASPGIGVPPRIRTIVDQRYRLSVIHGVDWGELYDLETDPGEFDNLWDSAAHGSVRQHLIERLLRLEIDAAPRLLRPDAIA